MVHELREEVMGASSSQTRATIADLTRAVERHEAQLHGIRNWMAAKAAYDRSIGEAMRARLDALMLNSGVDPALMPQVPIYLKNGILVLNQSR